MANRVPRDALVDEPRVVADGGHSGAIVSPLFRATVEATEKSVVNALLAAEPVTGRDGNALSAMPVDRTLEVLDAAGRLSAR